MLSHIIVQSNGVATGDSVSGGSSEYWKQLQALNVGVSKWISSHVDKNPHVDLTPIFRDYEKHLKAIDTKVSMCSLNKRGIPFNVFSGGSMYCTCICIMEAP